MKTPRPTLVATVLCIASVLLVAAWLWIKSMDTPAKWQAEDAARYEKGTAEASRNLAEQERQVREVERRTKK